MTASGLPLSPKQIRSIARSQSRINAWTGAIRSGKTIASLLRWLIYVAQAPPGELVVVAKTSQAAARNVFSPLNDFALFGELAAQSRYTPGAPSGMILGRRVWVMGTHDDRSEHRLRGLTCAGAYVDEGTLVQQSFFMQLLGRMSVPGAKLFLTTNPDNQNHWLRQDYFLRAGEPGIDLSLFHFTLDDNPSLTPEFVASVKAEFTGMWYRRFVLGEWCAAEGAVYDMFDTGRHVVDVLPVMKRWLAVGCDVGTKNPFAAIVLALGTDRKLYAVAEWYWDSVTRRRQLTDAEYSAKLRGFLASVRFPGSQMYGIAPERFVVDPSGLSFIRQLHSDLRLFPGGMSIAGADNAVLDGIRLVASLLGGGRLLIHSSCKNLIAQLQSYSWDEKAAARGEDKPVKENDHAPDALRYALATTRQVWRNLIVPAEMPVNYQDQFGVPL